MKERMKKKGIKKRLLSLGLALAMVLSLMPLDGLLVYAEEVEFAETIQATAEEVSGTNFKVTSTKYEDNGPGDGYWFIGGNSRANITVSRTAGNTTKNIGKLVFGYADIYPDPDMGWIDKDKFTGCEGATVAYDGVDKLTISGLNTSSITVGYSDGETALLPDYVEIYYVDAPAFEISNVEVDFSQIPIAVGTTAAQMNEAPITIRVNGEDMTNAFDISSRYLRDTNEGTPTEIVSNYEPYYNYIIWFKPKAGYSFASGFSNENISIITPSASNVDDSSSDYYSSLGVNAAFMFNTHPTKIEATGLKPGWVSYGGIDTSSDVRVLETSFADTITPNVTMIRLPSGIYDISDLTTSEYNKYFNEKTGKLLAGKNLDEFKVVIGEVYSPDDFEGKEVPVTDMKFTHVGNEPLTVEVVFSYDSKDYSIQYTAHTITYCQPKSSGSNNYENISVDVIPPNENASNKYNVTASNAPTGKEFIGWTRSRGGTTPYTFGSTLTANITLYPIWGDHVHTYAEEWTMDDTYHWHVATCSHTEEKSDYAAHSYDSETHLCVCGKMEPKWEVISSLNTDKAFTSWEDGYISIWDGNILHIASQEGDCKELDLSNAFVSVGESDDPEYTYVDGDRETYFKIENGVCTKLKCIIWDEPYELDLEDTVANYITSDDVFPMLNSLYSDTIEDDKDATYDSDAKTLTIDIGYGMGDHPVSEFSKVIKHEDENGITDIIATVDIDEGYGLHILAVHMKVVNNKVVELLSGGHDYIVPILHNHDDIDIVFKPLTKQVLENKSYRLDSDKNYFLVEDIDLGENTLRIDGGSTVNICLNGHDMRVKTIS